MRNGSLKRGIRLYKLKKFSQAVEELLSIDSDPSDNPEVGYFLGLCYVQLGNYDEALLYLEQAITSGIDILHLYQTRMLLGYIYTITRRYKLASFEFNKLLEAGYESPQVFAALGYVAFEQRKWEECIEFLEQAVALDPENPNALNSLGYVLAERNTRLEDAKTMCKKAVAKKPKNPAYLDSLGWVFYKLGQYEEARLYLRRGLGFAPGNKTIASHLKSVMEAV